MNLSVYKILLSTLFFGLSGQAWAAFECSTDQETAMHLCEYSYLADDNTTKTRTLYGHIPANWNPANPTPLVVALHGGGFSGKAIAGYSGLREFADQYGFLLAFPNGQEGHWNDGRALEDVTANDVEFLSRLVQDLVPLLNIPPQQVFLLGMSNGGIMTLKMACERPELFSAFAAVAATMHQDLIEQQCNPSSTSSILFTFGRSDQLMPYDQQGPIFFDRGIGVPISQSIDFWLAHNGCDTTLWEINQAQAALDPINAIPLDFTKVHRVESGPCQQGSEVAYLDVEGGGHRWHDPDVDSAWLPVVGRASREMDTTWEILLFFARHL